MFLFVLALVVLFAMAGSTLLKPKSVIAWLLGVYLLATANVVFVTELAGILGWLSTPQFFVIAHLVLLVLAAGVWKKAGNPKPWQWLDFSVLHPKKWFDAGQKAFDIKLLAVGAVIFYSINAILILIVPPNNNDSLAVHLARVGYWLQHGSFEPWPTNTIMQLVYPINAQVQILWTVLFTQSDRLAGFVQWMAVPFSMLAIYGLARFLGWKKQASIFAALIWATLPQILLQSTSTQNDLVVTGFFVTSIYFLFQGLESNSSSALALSGAGLGLAVGIKQSAFYLIPGLAIFLVILLIKNREMYTWPILTWIGCSFFSFILLGSYIYIVNTIEYRNPFGPQEFIRRAVVNEDFSLYNQTVLKISRWSYQMLDPIGLPAPVNGYFTRGKAKAANVIFTALDIPVESEIGVDQYPSNQFVLTEHPLVQEDVAWFGPLGYLLFLPVVIRQAIIGIRQKHIYKIGLMLLGCSLFLGVLLLKTGWTHNQGRYFILSVTCLAPFLAGFYSRERQRRILHWAVSLMAIVVMLTVTLNNAAKPLAGVSAIWKLDRSSLQTIQAKYLHSLIRLVDNNVPEDATLGILGVATREYPFFGAHFTRKLVLIYPPERLLDANWLLENNVEYVLFENAKFQSMGIPPYLEEIGHRTNYILLKNTLIVDD
ncbi:MAG: glycosyltransferase family 39 protein [Anaerolineales bacterium]|nr:glycosyltransferase family 39 protein [Anaerolineales bacterium]